MNACRLKIPSPLGERARVRGLRGEAQLAMLIAPTG